MSGSSSSGHLLPSGNKLRAIEHTIQTFEERSKWKVSLPGRVVLQQTFLSFATDRVGPDFDSQSERRDAQAAAIKALPDFLDHLADEAVDFLKARERAKDETTEIGAIFIVKHLDRWARERKCVCWPQG